METTHFKKGLPLPPYYLRKKFATGTIIILHVCEKKCHEPFVTTPGGTEGTTLHMVESAVRLWTFPTTQSSQTFITEGLTTVSSIGKLVIPSIRPIPILFFKPILSILQPNINAFSLIVRFCIIWILSRYTSETYIPGEATLPEHMQQNYLTCKGQNGW